MTTRTRPAFWIPVFDEPADPRVVARLAAEEVDHVRGILRDGPATTSHEEAVAR